MKKFFFLFFSILKSKKFFSIEKKELLIFDKVNSDILVKILPSSKTGTLIVRFDKNTKLLINFKIVIFILKNLCTRSIQLNYFISYINQVNPKFVITTIDNSITFSTLAKYFENKIKFLAIQNATRNDFYENTEEYNASFYFTNYFVMSDFDRKMIEKKKNIKVRNFFIIGSLRNSYYKYYIQPFESNDKKKYDICFVNKRLFKFNKPYDTPHAKISLKLLKFLSQYISKYNYKSLVIQSKSFYSDLENKIYEDLFNKLNFKIIWRDYDNHNSYKTVSSSNIILGPPSTLLREAIIYPNTKVICFSSERERNEQHPFPDKNFIDEMTYEKFEQELNFYSELRQEEYAKKTNTNINYVMCEKNSAKSLMDLIEKNSAKIL